MGHSTMKTSAICLSFLFCLASVVLTSEEEERFDLSSITSLLGLGAAGLAGAGLATAAGSLSGLTGGKGKGKGKDGGLFGLFGKDGLFGGKAGKDGKGKGKGKRRSLIKAEQERQDLSTLLSLASLIGGNGGAGPAGIAGLLGGNSAAGLLPQLLGGNNGVGSLLQLLGGNGAPGLTNPLGGDNLANIFEGGKAGKGGKGGKAGKAGKAGKDGKGGNAGKDGKGGKGGKDGNPLEQLFNSFAGRSSKLLETERHGKGKEGKGKGKEGKEGKGKGKEGKGGKDSTESTGSSPIDILSDSLSKFGLLGQIIQGVLNLLTGAVSSLNPFKSAIEAKTTTPPLPNPVTDPLGFIQSPLISAFLNAILNGDPSALMKPLGDLAGTLITQFIMNSISG